MRTKVEPAYCNGYQDGEELVLLRRDASGALREKRTRAEWVSYFKLSELGEMRRTIEASNFVLGSRVEKEWLRVLWRDQEARDRICKSKESPLRARGIPTYEGDVTPLRRYLVDNGTKIARPRRGYFDIETDSRVPIQLAKDGEARMLSWAIVDAEGKRISGCLADEGDAAETELLGALWEQLQLYDQIVVWHGSWNRELAFDFSVLFARTQHLGIRGIDARRIMWVDQLPIFLRSNLMSAESGDEKSSYKLGDIAQEIVGEGKDDFDARYTWEAWAAGGSERERMVRYNVKDADLLRRIEGETGYLDLLQTIAEATHIFPDAQAENPTTYVDSFMLRLGLEHGFHFPTKQYAEGVEQFKGAFVMEPRVDGIETDVHVCDFASLYPSIIVSWNMSPETFVGHAQSDVDPIPKNACRAPKTLAQFRTDVKGVLPLAVETILGLRKKWSDAAAQCAPGTPEHKDAMRRATAYKQCNNSFYGVVSSPFSRFYDRRVGEAITQAGVWLLETTIAEAERWAA